MVNLSFGGFSDLTNGFNWYTPFTPSKPTHTNARMMQLNNKLRSNG
jgi:hypothetical protein